MVLTHVLPTVRENFETVKNLFRLFRGFVRVPDSTFLLSWQVLFELGFPINAMYLYTEKKTI